MLNTKTAHMPSQVALRLAQEATLNNAIENLRILNELNQEFHSSKLEKVIYAIQENIREMPIMRP